MKNSVELEKQVKAALTDNHLALPDTKINVRCQDGTVVLEGTVSRFSQSKRAERVASSVEGVGKVENNILVNGTFSRSDGEIRKLVVDAFTQDRYINETAINVAVTNGIVTLTGSTESLVRKRLAGVLAWWVPGTKKVINELEIIYPESDDDEQITAALRAVVEKDPLVDSVEISIGTDHGVVTIGGAVDGEVEKNAAENDAWLVLGVKDVVNLIQVVPPQTQEDRSDFGG